MDDRDHAATATTLPPALPGTRIFIEHAGRQLALYVASGPGPADAEHPPLLLLHSVNAGATAAEVRPVFERYAGVRPVVAIELPGFGSSDRGERPYTPAQMAGALLTAMAHLRSMGWHQPADVMALSLSCEFAARAAVERPALFRSLALVSPTGLEATRHEAYAGGRTRERPALRRLFALPAIGGALYRLLTSRPLLRLQLRRIWGAWRVDEGLVDYGHRSARAPGARHAPLAFVSGALFTRGVAALYRRLTMPVWVAHGSRGAYSDFGQLEALDPSARWTQESFASGAFPHFELPRQFCARYDAFLARARLLRPAPALAA